jgi:hypothetical protein
MFGTHRHARQNEEMVTKVRSAFILFVPPLYFMPIKVSTRSNRSSSSRASTGRRGTGC